MKSQSNIKNWQYFLIMSFAVTSWALAFPFIKIGLEELSFINLTILRLFLVCIAFIPIIIILNKKISKLQKKDIIPIFLLGFFGVTIYHLGLNYGEITLTAATASLIIATIPVFILIFASLFLKEKPGNYKIIGIILAFFGVLIISLFGRKDAKIEFNYLFAIGAVFVSAIVAALYTIAGKKFLVRYNGLSLTAYAIILGSFGLIPLLHPSINNSFISEISNLSINGWLAVLFLAIFSTVISYSIWYIALQYKTASELSIFLYANPVIASIVSYILFKDPLTEYFILGGSLVIFGLFLVNKKIKINKKID